MIPDQSLPLGTPVDVVTGRYTYPLEALGAIDARKAMAETLMAFLGRADFRRAGGTAADDFFNLKRVWSTWPDPRQGDLEYPSASLSDPLSTTYGEHALTPTPLEDTVDVFCAGTVLWKTAEANLDFQVDFWANDEPTRQAIAARLPSLFNPYEDRAGVILSGHPQYFFRRVRATLLNEPRRVDVEAAVYEGERRLLTLVRCDIDVVQLRTAVELNPVMKPTDGLPEDC